MAAVGQGEGGEAAAREDKAEAARRNLSRSEEDDSDDSGVIRDVRRPGMEQAGLDRVEAEVALHSEPAAGDPDKKEKAKPAERPPPKKSYLDYIEQKPSPKSAAKGGLRFHVGDLVWGRAAGSYFHPSVVTQDPHFKFHTKIVKSEPGSSAVDHETGKVRGAVEEPCRQYHLQQLGDNRRLWVPSNLIIPFTGIADYEQLAIQDVKNINKIYKPKTEAAKMSWREAVLVAQQLEPMVPAERVRKCDWARLREIGGPALQKKLEYDNKKREAEEEGRGRKEEGDSGASPEKFKSPSSPRKGGEETERRKSDQVRRKEEMDYKMFRMSSMQKKSDDKKEERKRKRSEGSESGSPTKTPVTEPSPTVTTFNRSFKVKKEVKIKTESDNFVESKKVDGEKSEDAEEAPQSNSNGSGRGVELNSSAGVSNGGVKGSASAQPGGGGEGGGLGRGVAKDIETETAVEGMGEGTLVWAKMRGYSFWPCVVSRDPEGGEFVKMPADCLSKSQKKIHVLFLEYNNQRAWIQLTSIKPYKGLEDFNEQKEAASKTKIKDFEPGKRYEGQFSRAVEYAEELAQLTDDDRLEQVLLRYGWVMVDGQEDGPKKKKRRTVKPDTGCSELNRSTATDSEADKEVEQGGSPVPPRPSAVSSDRRSSAEAESRLDPTPDPPSTTLSSSKKKRTSSVIASMALNGDSSSSEGESDTDEKRSKRSRKKVVKLVVNEEVKKKVSKPAASKPAAAAPSVPTAAAMKALAGEEEFPRVGDLVWGRMAGFPFWPSFVTRSPQGQYCRDGGKGRMSYHVQFFNWNDESGWVNSALEFDGLEPFKKIAAKKKSDKSYHPAKGAMHSKWEKAAREAEETMGLTRTERAEAYLVAYGGSVHPPVKPATPKTPKTKAAAKSPAVPKAKPSPAPAKKPALTPVKRRTPGPASKTGRPVVPLPKRPLMVEAPEELPEGWRVSSKGGAGQTFISPDGREFLERTAALAYSATAAASPARYLEDSSLPAGWRVQSIGSSIYYFSPRGERFETREAVADRLAEEGLPAEVVEKARAGARRRPGPRSAMIKLGELGYQSEEGGGSSGEEDDPESILRLPNGMRYRKGGVMDAFLDLDKIFDPSNGGMIEMVQLPDIFLDHPTVSVTESDNEMVISDVDTGEFIAKKIIYD